MASKSITAENLDVYWAFCGPSLTCCWRSSSPFAICNWTRGSNVVVRGRRFLARKYIDLKSLSTMFLFFALLSSASLAAAEHCSCRTLCSYPCSAIRAWITASLWHFDWLCSLSCSVAWFQSWILRVVHAPLAVEGAFPRFWQSLQNMPCLGSSQYTQEYFCSHSFL